MRDHELLQGTWNVSKLEVDGQKMPAGMLGEAQIVINGNRFVSSAMGAVYEGTIEIDASTSPRQITMHFEAGPEKGNSNLGIYEIDRDTLKICLATRGTVRPARFASKTGTGFALETLKRSIQKRRETPKATARPLRKPSAGKNPTTAFEGEWRMVSGITNGVAMDKSTVQWVKRLTVGDETTVYAGPQVMMKMKFSTDSSKSPKAIDYVNTAGAHKGKTQQGIFEFEGTVLKICVAPPGSARPKEFESKPGDGRMLTVWERTAD